MLGLVTVVSNQRVLALQIEGAFVMGLGLCTSEEVLIEAGTGKLLSDSTWTYKIPTAADTPRQFNVTFLKDSPTIRSASFGIILESFGIIWHHLSPFNLTQPFTEIRQAHNTIFKLPVL